MTLTPPSHILYEDNHLLIVNKKPSQIVQGDKTGDVPLSDLFREFIRLRDNKPGNVFLGVVHRIDRPVSGTLVFAKTSKALRRMYELFRDGKVQKKYWAIVSEKPEIAEDHLCHFLTRNEKQNKSYVHDKDIAGSKRAELKYRHLSSSDRYHLIEVELLTGRHHQIRAQLAHIGCPIKGDLKYGYPRSNPDASISLHSRSIEFIHPVNKEIISVLAPAPDDILWKFFESL